LFNGQEEASSSDRAFYLFSTSFFASEGKYPPLQRPVVLSIMMLIPQELEGFDVKDAVARMLDRPELWWQAVGFFVQHFSGWENAWLDVRGNDQAERRCVHAIRSAAANVGAMRLSALAERLEKLLLQRIAGEDVKIPVDLRADLAAAFSEAWKSADAAWREAGCELPEQS